MKKQKGASFKLAYLAAALIPMLIAAIGISLFSLSSLNTRIANGVYDELKVAACQVREYFQYDISTKGSVDMTEYSDHEYISSLQDDGVEMTLFQDKTRVLTSIKDSNGNYIEGTDASDAVYAAVSSGQDYKSDSVTINNETYYVYYTPITDADGNFWGMGFAGEKAAKVTDAVNNVAKNLFFITGIIVVVLCVIMFFLGKFLAATLTKTTRNLDNLSNGHLDSDFNMHSSIREFNELIASGAQLQERLGEIIGKTKNISGELKDGADLVSQLSNDSSVSANQISSAMEDLAQGASSMAESVQSINEQVVEMGHAIDDISSNAGDLAASSNNIKSANDDASEYIGLVSESSAQTVEAVHNISGQIADTNNAIDKIKDAVAIIRSIAGQTNLLALNASIEAARAGESGKGFAVVATEIKTLSEQTQASTTQIADIVDEIVEKSNRSVELSEEVATTISKEKSFIEDTQKKFQVLNEEIAASLVQIDHINEKISSLNYSKDSITSSVADLGAISEENAASNEEASASITKIAESIHEIANNSGSTKDNADNLNETVAYFK